MAVVRRFVVPSVRSVLVEKTGPVRKVTLPPRVSADREEAAKAAVRDDLKLIANIDADIDALIEKRDAALARIEAEMRAALLKVVTGSGKVAELAEKYTRQSRNIDPQKFRNRVDNGAFWGSISVSVQQAKKYLSDRELDAISDVVPAQSMGVSLTVTDAKKSKSK